MPASRNLPIWHGRILALAGILLVAFNLRSAVAALSPIFTEIRADVPISSVDVGILGMLPPVCFAVFGIVSPAFTRRLSLEAVMVLALAAVLAGHVLRALSGSFLLLAAFSALAFAGMGVGNVLLPPLVKRYFGDRIGAMTALYATIMAVSTLIPPLVAVPVADAAGWRLSVAMWGSLSLLAVLPWLGVLVRRRPRAAAEGALEVEPRAEQVRGVWRAPISWALAAIFAVSALNAYSMFAWLPEIVRDVAGVDPTGAGILLSLFAAMGIPAGLLVPVLATRMRNVALLVYFGVAMFLLGYGGLILIPGVLTWLWVGLAGLGPLLFPICLVLINLRTRTHAGSVALSGFVQGLGYILGALGPLFVGVLHQVTGEWTSALLMLLATALAGAVAGSVVARPHMLEDQLGQRSGSRPSR